MTAPQDPFAAPDQPPAGYGTPAPSYGTPPAYGSTPYGTAPSDAWQGPPLASWGKRALGYLVDLVISIVIQGLAALIDPDLGRAVGFAVALVFGYLTGTTGQTPGRRVVGIKVLREADGQVLGAGLGIGRGLLHILDALPLLLGFLWPIWDKKKQTFADKIVHSVVVNV
ncbi:MAG: RDD family protein [Actinobacteria bacterium]|nr:RDD family protein [Actinomycetota bacterium]MCA1721847.1 RDD family protein [Actinomycetota bacterium]